MTVYDPTTHPVEFSEEEIETLTKANQYLTAIAELMDEYNCTTLVGGYEECPMTFTSRDIENICQTLDVFVNNVPHEMY